ncbi:MAG: 50S ribosomal protein L23 [Candidatus Planktophila sp.]|jgi:large subunit ribosomal protein L23|nr:50S ribosomal protein L23 [Candidatus Planktophila sp.]
MKNHRDILIAPVVSEKSYGLLDQNKYTFIVAPDANKTEIKIAVEKVFNVKVVSVNTLNREGKSLRTRFGIGKRKDTKRAIVKVAAGQRIDIFGGPVS